MDWIRVTRLLTMVCLLAGLLAAAAVGAAQIEELERQYALLGALQDSLRGDRAALVEEAGALSARIDHLKSLPADSEELHQALRASLVLEQRLGGIDHRLEGVHRDRNVAGQHLRVAYDQKIGAVIQQLAEGRNGALLRQLERYERARETLMAGASGSRISSGEGMDISPHDGPDVIGQKAALMEDIVAQLRLEGRQTATRLVRLQEEHRLRVRVQLFTSGLSLFDEHLPEGRVLFKVQQTGGPTGEASGNPDAAGSGDPTGQGAEGQDGIGSGAPAAIGSEAPAPEDPGAEEFDGLDAGPEEEPGGNPAAWMDVDSGGDRSSPGGDAEVVSPEATDDFRSPDGFKSTDGDPGLHNRGPGLDNGTDSPDPDPAQPTTDLEPLVHEVLVGRLELVRQGPLTLEGLAADDVAVEIYRLKQRQLQIRRLEEAARQRAEAFRSQLQRLLEGRE